MWNTLNRLIGMRCFFYELTEVDEFYYIGKNLFFNVWILLSMGRTKY